ncbi:MULTISPECIES: rhodanese-like domain-containing protein [unclassified Aureispira]|uniref:MBL fold metallo-hydrolase n=1 Tax=unclassified Aureispira TaxID=2649989 RepID=UPI000697C535|nr:MULTISPECIES: MBL fold metallo-hydrolase [unclassified Aureispira]WMX16358.1 MBL fold metallo-hydrolase [Aureispira sp. CCB-E]
MKIEQIYTGCLAQGAYYIESQGEAVIIDPLRETKPYIERAQKDGATIKYILETHFHADFVSGHVDLAQKTGATIVYGPNAETAFEAYIAQDEEILRVGEIGIKVLHTPGHTMESTSYLLLDANGKETALFSGDTLFIGDVGRPDLAVKTHLTREDLAGHLFDSLRHKIMPLPDDVIVYPAHGAGSACGKNMSKETFDTLGNQKATNYALRANMSKDEFIEEVTSGLTQAPQYFPKNALLNKNGYESIDTVFERGVVALSPNDFEGIANETGALILDTRAPQTFKDAFVPNSINIGIDGGFAPWVGALIIDLKQPIVLVTDEGRAKEVVTRLARVGYDNVLGYLEGGIEAWTKAGKEIDQITSISAQDLEQELANNELNVLDVRKPNEFKSEHIVGASNFPLDYINDNIDELNRDTTYHIHCAGGYRSMITSSILKARGFHNLVEIAGGFKAIAATEIPKTEFVCPTTLS